MGFQQFFQQLWELDVPVEELPSHELAWHLDVPFLGEHGAYDLKPRQVLDAPDLHREEYERTMRADLMHPIDVMANKGRWLILDGLHRLMKAHALGMGRVRVRKIPREFIPRIQR